MNPGRIGSVLDGSSKPENNPQLDPRVVKAEAWHYRITWSWRILVILLIGACLLFLVQNSARQTDTLNAVRAAQKENVTKIDNSAKAVEILKDCTADTDSPCAKRNARNLAKALDQFSDQTLIVVAAIVSCQQQGIVQQDALVKCASARLSAN